MQNPPQEPQEPQTPQEPMYQPHPTQPTSYPSQYQPHPTQPTSYPSQYQPHPTQPTSYPSQYPPQYPPQQPPQYPVYPPAPPATVYYQNQSFTGKAVAAFLLYWLGYIPGLIFNIMFINEARRVEVETGRTPSGYGCLWATLIGSLVPALLFIALCFLIFAAMMAGGAATN